MDTSACDMGRILAAAAICILGMGALDQVLDLFRPYFVDVAQPGAAPQLVHIRPLPHPWIKPGIEIVGIGLMVWAALGLLRPQGIRRNDAGIIVLLDMALTTGRSAFGIGEGFSADFLLIALPGTLVGLALHRIWPSLGWRIGCIP
ncbi:MAG: hypothetical protein Q4G22_13905 [Paracoccus sp. (in: a-proteobacteria)]|uniref:hypothetical protein n=1 Tax=Paracoccus sp. TaxID=267 RepID=UPI0026DF6431|nr:hypothetical protein [Paracoccus sp. (in: a-proteobacteria)]MDO5632912.1 hypothetical protein [Paracoccus sp. (in: a-proteobacteria)]